MSPAADPELSHHFAIAPDGAKLSYYSAGTGDGVLVLHGSFTYALSHSELAAALSPHYAVHLVSRRGRGLSGSYPSSVTALDPHHEPQAAKAPKSEKGSSDPVSVADPIGHLIIGSKTHTRTYSPALTAAVVATEISDLETLIKATSATYIIGVSSGALLALQALLQDPKSPALARIRKVVIFEPPILFTNKPTSCGIDKLPRFERELQDGDEIDAAITAMHMVQLGPGWIPRWLMKAMTGMMFHAQDKAVEKKRAASEEDEGVCTMSGLTRLLRYDFMLVEGMVAEAGRCKVLSPAADGASPRQVEILLLSGAKSPAFLAEGMDTLRETISGARSVVISGVGHELLCNAEMRGQPARAVATIRNFFDN